MCYHSRVQLDDATAETSNPSASLEETSLGGSREDGALDGKALDGSARDEKANEHLRLLVAFHYAIALLTVAKFVLGLPLLIPGAIGYLGDDAAAGASEAPAWFQTLVDFAAYSFDAPVLADEPLFIAFLLMMTGLSLVLVSLVHGAFLFWIARCIRDRKNRKTVVFFCWMDLLYFPFGTVLSIAFLLVHRRPEVRAQFDASAS